jgi:hypothetical protein
MPLAKRQCSRPPPAILKDKGEVAAAEPEHNDGNNTETTLTDCTTIYGVAGPVLESTFGDQARYGDALTDTICDRRQQLSSVEGMQQQHETTQVMVTKRTRHRCAGQHVVGHPFLLLEEMMFH